MVIEIRDRKLYYVGGVVRDEILGVPSLDVDLCYEGNAIKFAHEKGFEIIRENPDFGTVRVLVKGKEIDIASTRTETYPRVGHLPVVENIGCSLRDDLARRDFTINAMAKNTVTGEIIDYCIALDIIKKSGSWFSYNGERIGQGKDNVRKLIESNPALLAELDMKIRSMKDKLADKDDEFELDEDDDEFDIRTMGEDDL